MKFFVSLFLIATLSFAACLFLPWWVIAIAGLIVTALIPQTPLHSFFAGFLALFFLWGGMSFFISTLNDHLLAHKISMLFIKIDNPILIIILTAFIGGLVAGLGSLTGSYIRSEKRAH